MSTQEYQFDQKELDSVCNCYGLRTNMELPRHEEPKWEETNFFNIRRRSVTHTVVEDKGINLFNLPVVEPLAAK